MADKIKTLWRRNRLLCINGLVLFIINILIVVLWLCFGFFSGSVTLKPGLSNELMTIDSVFAGFSYTTLGTMVSFTASAKVKQINKDGYLDKYYNGVYVTIGIFIAAIAVGSLTCFSVLGLKHHSLFVVQFLLNLDAFVFFLLSVVGFRQLINWIRQQ